MFSIHGFLLLECLVHIAYFVNTLQTIPVFRYKTAVQEAALSQLVPILYHQNQGKTPSIIIITIYKYLFIYIWYRNVVQNKNIYYVRDVFKNLYIENPICPFMYPIVSFLKKPVPVLQNGVNLGAVCIYRVPQCVPDLYHCPISVPIHGSEPENPPPRNSPSHLTLLTNHANPHYPVRMSISVKFDKRTLERAMKTADPKQVMFAAAVAMTRTATMAKGEIRDEMQAVFENPSRFTLNSTFSTKATKSKMQAIVGIKDQARYLVPQVTGGPRGRKRSEALLYPVLRPRRFYTPAGNRINRGELNQVLSFFKVRQDEAQNTTPRSQKRKKAPPKFSAVKMPGHKGKHIYKRVGRRLKLVYWSAKQPTYKKRLNIRSVVSAVVDVHMGRQFEIALDEALRSAK